MKYLLIIITLALAVSCISVKQYNKDISLLQEQIDELKRSKHDKIPSVSYPIGTHRTIIADTVYYRTVPGYIENTQIKAVMTKEYYDILKSLGTKK